MSHHFCGRVSGALSRNALRVFVTMIILQLASISLAQDSVENSTEEGAAPGANSTMPSAERVTIRTGDGAEAIARRWPERAVWLELADQSKVVSLLHRELEMPAKGAMLLLTDEEQTAASETAVAIAVELAESGWATMTLGLKPAPAALLQKRNRPRIPDSGSQGSSEAGESTTEDAAASNAVMIDVMDEGAEEEIEAYRKRVVEELTAATEALSARGYQRVVLASIGWGAGHVTRQVREDARASNLVWIAPRFNPSEEEELSELLSGASAPSILELHASRAGATSGMGQTQAAVRAAQMQRAGISGYERQPVAIANRILPANAPMLAGRIRSWLVTVKK